MHKFSIYQCHSQICEHIQNPKDSWTHERQVPLYMLEYHYLLSQLSEFCSHTPLSCFSTGFHSYAYVGSVIF